MRLSFPLCDSETEKLLQNVSEVMNMKLKKRLTLLLLSLIICSFVIPSGVQAINTEDHAAEATQNIDDDIFIDSFIEVPMYSDINDYNNFLQNLLVDKPFNFVTFSMLEGMGTFVYFQANSFVNPHRYSYMFVDENNYYYGISISHKKDSLNSEGFPLIDAPENLEDMRYVDTDKPNCSISKNGIEYSYVSGKLIGIRWSIGDVVLTVYPSSNYVDRFTTYPLDHKATFLSNILSADGTKATLAISKLCMQILWGWIWPIVIAVILVVAACILAVFLNKKRRIHMSNQDQCMEPISEDEYSSNKPLE